MKDTMPISKQSSEALAAKIISYRVLNLNKGSAKEAMVELERRKINGNSFDFLSYIEDKVKSIPSISVGVEQMDAIQKTLRNIKNGSF